jgi:hypothetical protein
MKTRFEGCGLEEHQVFWNEQGAVVCACCHIPYPGSDTWVSEGWEEITPDTMNAMNDSSWVKCEKCGKVPSRIVRVSVH